MMKGGGLGGQKGGLGAELPRLLAQNEFSILHNIVNFRKYTHFGVLEPVFDTFLTSLPITSHLNLHILIEFNEKLIKSENH